MSIITDNIDKLIDERGIDKKAFYKEIGVSASAYSQWRLRQSYPRFDKLLKAADFFNVDIADIVSGKTPMSFGSTPLIDAKKAITNIDDGLNEKYAKYDVLIDLFDSLPPDRQDAVIRQLQEIVRLQKAQDDLLKF